MKTCKTVTAGDSIIAGNHTPGFEIPTLIAAALPSITVVSIAVPSSTIDSAGQGATADSLFDAAKQVNIVLVMLGINNIGGGATASATFALFKAWCLARRANTGAKVIASTMTASSSFNTERNAFNALVRADTSFYDVLADVGLNSTTMGADAAASDTLLYSDGIHPTAFGNGLLTPYYTTAITSLLSTPRHFGTVFAGVVR